VTVRDPPFSVWIIDREGRLVDTLQPDYPDRADAASRRKARWAGLGTFRLSPGFLQIVADLASDARYLIAYGPEGGIVSRSTVIAPFGFVATAREAHVLLAIQTFNESELVTYTWSWSQQSEEPQQ